MTKPGMGYEHQKRRAQMPPPQGEPCPCTGCAKHPGHPCLRPMWPSNTDADHTQARILGGGDGPLRWMCRPCNRSRGATLGNRLRGAQFGRSKEVPSTCSHCKKTYLRRTANQRFCSQACREAMAYKTRAPKPPAPAPLRAAVPPLHVNVCSVCDRATLNKRTCSPPCSKEQGARDMRNLYRAHKGMPPAERPTKGFTRRPW